MKPMQRYNVYLHFLYIFTIISKRFKRQKDAIMVFHGTVNGQMLFLFAYLIMIGRCITKYNQPLERCFFQTKIKLI